MTGSFEQSDVIRDWLASFLPERVLMMAGAAVDHDIKSIIDTIIAPELICDHWNEGLAGLFNVHSIVDKPS